MDDELIKKTFKRLETQFDVAFTSLLDKLRCHQQWCCDAKSRRSRSNTNQEVSTDNDYGDDGNYQNEVCYYCSPKDSLKEVVALEEHSQSGSKDYSNEETYDVNDNDDDDGIIDHIEPELIKLALSHAKMMTKAFLYAERMKQLEQQVHKLEIENFKLRSFFDGEQDLLMAKCYLTTRPLPSLKKLHKNEVVSKNVTNLIMLKNTIEQEMNQEHFVERKLNQISMMKLRYENKICGLNLAVDYLKKELAGRVQQLQLLNINGALGNIIDGDEKSSNGDKLNDELLMVNNEDLFKIWNQISYEITLNRFKTLIRLAEISEHLDSIDDQDEMEENENNEQEKTKDNLNKLQSILLTTGVDLTAKSEIKKTQKKPCDYYEKMGQVRFISIYLERDNQLGLQLIGGGTNTPLIIWKILPKSSIACKGYFCPGDIILSIQSNDMIGKTKEYAWKIMQESLGSWCRFGILRIPILKNRYQLQYNFELFHDDLYEIQVHQQNE